MLEDNVDWFVIIWQLHRLSFNFLITMLPISRELRSWSQLQIFLVKLLIIVDHYLRLSLQQRLTYIVIYNLISIASCEVMIAKIAECSRLVHRRFICFLQRPVTDSSKGAFGGWASNVSLLAYFWRLPLLLRWWVPAVQLGVDSVMAWACYRTGVSSAHRHGGLDR